MGITDKFSLEGKLAWVTGASYGIGYAIALCYAKAGAKVAFNCRHQDGLEKALANYTADGAPDVRGYICDVTDEAQVKATLTNIEKDFGQSVDILVNNAGIIKRIPMTEMSVEEFRQDMVCGGFLIVVGLLMAFGLMDRLHRLIPV